MRKILSKSHGAILFLIVFSMLIFGLVPQAEAGTINLKFANYYPPQAPQSKICEQFIADLEKETGGAVKVSYFAGGALLKGPAIIKGIESGIADIGLSHIQYTPGKMPVSEACDLPLGFPSSWVASHVVSDFQQEFSPQEWNKVHCLWFLTNTPSVLVSTKPIRSLEDLKGVTVRAPGPIGEVIDALGGSPAPTPIVETYDALAKGVVSGAYVSSETLKTFRFAEVAKYATLAWHTGSTYTFYVVMNKRRYQSLPPEIKSVLDRLSGVYQERMAMMWDAIDYAGQLFAKELGVEFIDLSAEEFERWQKAASPVIEAYIDRMKKAGYSEAEVKTWLDFIKQRNDYWTQEQIRLNLKTITGPLELRP